MREFDQYIRIETDIIRYKVIILYYINVVVV